MSFNYYWSRILLLWSLLLYYDVCEGWLSPPGWHLHRQRVLPTHSKRDNVVGSSSPPTTTTSLAMSAEEEEVSSGSEQKKAAEPVNGDVNGGEAILSPSSSSSSSIIHHNNNNNADTSDIDSSSDIQLDDNQIITTTDTPLPLAPPLTYDKFLTMQQKRVVVTIRYSGESGLRPYFLTVAKKLKASHPDVVIERRILPSIEPEGSSANGDAVFEILVDGKVVIGKNNRTRRQRVAMEVKRSRSVFVSMQELDVAIARARRRRRPTTAYGKGGAEPDTIN